MPDSSRIEIISKSLDSLVTIVNKQSAVRSTYWTTLIPLLIGAGLTLVTTLLIELYKSRKEKLRNIQLIISKAKAKTYLIAQLLQDLAMYRVLKQYYIRAYKLEKKPSDQGENFKKQYETGKDQRLTKAKLDETVAEYFQIVTEYLIATKKQNTYSNLFDQIFHYQHPPTEDFKNCKNEDDLIKTFDQKLAKLNLEYKSFFDLIEAIQISMT